MKKISYSAPAKVILSGEHAVVYGKPALVSALNLRLKFSLWESKKTKEDKIVLFISQIIKNFLKKEKIYFIDKSYDFEIKSRIPIQQHLGSSAALSVAAASAFLKFYTNKEFEIEVINNVAYQIEKYFHKNASGVDTSVSSFGGLIFYRKEFEFLKTISSLNFKIPKRIEENLFLIDSGKSLETTGEMVEIVGKLYNKKPQLVEQILNDIEKVTKRMVISIIKEDIGFFEQCIADNQIYLEILGVSSKKASMLLQKLSIFGVGKVTGGGGKKEGSGYMVFFANKKKELENYCRNKKISYFKFNQSYKGVKIEL